MIAENFKVGDIGWMMWHSKLSYAVCHVRPTNLDKLPVCRGLVTTITTIEGKIIVEIIYKLHDHRSRLFEYNKTQKISRVLRKH